jgi:hypothetical protein
MFLDPCFLQQLHQPPAPPAMYKGCSLSSALPALAGVWNLIVAILTGGLIARFRFAFMEPEGGIMVTTGRGRGWGSA